MKKIFFKVMAVIALAALVSGCTEMKSEDDATSRSTRYRGYSIVDGKIVAIDNDGNPHDLPEGLLPELRAERTYKEEGANPLVAMSLAHRQLNTASPATAETLFSYNYGIQNKVTAVLWLQWGEITLRPLDTLFVKGYHVVDNTATGPFVEQSHTQYTLCWADGSTVVISGDSITCRQNFSVREVLPTVIHDTVWQDRVIHDTVWRERVVHDTIHQIDTVWQVRVIHDTVVDGRWVDSVVTRRQWVVSHHHIATTTTDTYTPTTATYTVRCTNRTDSSFTERLYLFYSDQTVDSSRVRNWIHSVNWQKVWSRSVTLNGSNPGSGRVNISGGTASFGGGNSVVFSAPTITTTPVAGMENATTCNDVLMYATAVSGGVNVRTVVNHGGTGDSTQGFIPWTGTTPPPPTVTSIDTLWGACTTANAWYQATPTEQVRATVGKTYRLVRTWSDNHHDTINGGTATTTYVWNIIRTGQPTSAMASTLPVNGNPASFGGGAFTEGLTQVGSQRFCPLTWTSAVLTSSTATTGTTTWTGTYGTTTVTVTIPEVLYNPTPIFSTVLAAAATDSYTHQIFSQTSYRHTFVCVVAQIGSDYRFYWAELAPNLVRADFDSVSITATEANFYVNHLSDGYYPAMVYDHNNHTSLYRGVVTSVELGTGWQQTYRLAPSNSLAYVMGGSSWTMAGDSGRNAVRGVMNSSGQILADGITVQLY